MRSSWSGHCLAGWPVAMHLNVILYLMFTYTFALVHGQSTLPFPCHVNKPRYGKQSFQLLSYQLPTCETALNLGENHVVPQSSGKRCCLTQLSFLCDGASKVKVAVHRHIAQLMSWSMRYAGAGVWPSKGFRDEEFSPKSLRAKLRPTIGQRVEARGIQLSLCLLFGVNVIIMQLLGFDDIEYSSTGYK